MFMSFKVKETLRENLCRLESNADTEKCYILRKTIYVFLLLRWHYYVSNDAVVCPAKFREKLIICLQVYS